MRWFGIMTRKYVSFVHTGKSENCIRVTSLPPTRKSISYDSILAPSPSANHLRFFAGSEKAAKTRSGGTANLRTRMIVACVARLSSILCSFAKFSIRSLCRRPVIVNDVAVRERTRLHQRQWQTLFERLEWRLAFSENNGADHNLQLIDQPRLGKLRHNCPATENAHPFSRLLFQLVNFPCQIAA